MGCPLLHESRCVIEAILERFVAIFFLFNGGYWGGTGGCSSLWCLSGLSSFTAGRGAGGALKWPLGGLQLSKVKPPKNEASISKRPYSERLKNAALDALRWIRLGSAVVIVVAYFAQALFWFIGAFWCVFCLMFVASEIRGKEVGNEPSTSSELLVPAGGQSRVRYTAHR